ncbi:1-deoxy-D-xylulose 5-phosphate reductoisomerase [Cohaesibacter marisflavi]|uniref:1-deoxy-D-xylulose 5-phosphate reductoisomerase n=1 Tax=Cohaesibacter marisflavi TaxID=655353 RepID=A0A1I5FLQ2_9HYPH|nr:1-deoxy-D-xylulose-5-phosphate reductoisomerase [Cohaesibacter marisflavi]SFO24675.1 1-deoxy-D-xylulose 5-phosphate reductoisomerase [Cohaesibacter marisflavi]
MSKTSSVDSSVQGSEGTPKIISVLGASGSVGDSALDIIAGSPDRYRVNALTANRNVGKLARAAVKSGARFAVVADEGFYADLRDALSGHDIEVGAGQSAVEEAAGRSADIVIGAIVGAAGICPTLAALKAGNQVALANKEALVCAGDLVMAETQRLGKPILPVDSEHSAVFQVYERENRAEISKIVLTASGGPFRTWDRDAIAKASIEQALAHPNFSMGNKITIDSASMMNKGLELIEAHHLYGVSADKLKVVVHPQQIIHGMVAYSDGSLLAQLGAPDMRIPVAHCLAWPERAPANTDRISLVEIGQFTFEAPDYERFPCLRLAKEALEAGGSLPNIMNAANEIAVAAFLAGDIAFGGIAELVEKVMAEFVRRDEVGAASDVGDVLALDQAARNVARQILS